MHTAFRSGCLALALLGCGSRTGLSLAGDPALNTGESTTGGASNGDGGSGGGVAPSTGGSEAGTGAQPSFVDMLQVEVGLYHSCALSSDGQVRCWGEPASGRLGYGNSNGIGQTPAELGDVPLGGPALDLTVGAAHSCALLDTGRVRCWGRSPGNGRTGVDVVGDDETPEAVGDVDVGGPVVRLAAGTDRTCALLTDGAVRCWGPEELTAAPSTLATEPLGGIAVDLACGHLHCCALLDTGGVRCWGGVLNAAALGYGTFALPGEEPTPAELGDVAVGGKVVQVVTGHSHTCALLDTGNVRCWGEGSSGALGYPYTYGQDIGDDEPPATAGDVEVGGSVVQLAAGEAHTCALLATRSLRCWGQAASGALGYGNTNVIGDDETPAAAGDLPIGELVLSVAAGNPTCVLLASGTVKCWGPNPQHRLGFPGDTVIGDDETPVEIPVVPMFEP